MLSPPMKISFGAFGRAMHELRDRNNGIVE
jgi:hypothetical protein